MDKSASHADDTATRFDPLPPIFETYLEARSEANRRMTREGGEGFVLRVTKTPYGNGYVLRRVPLDVLADPDFGLGVTALGGRPVYQDL